MRERASGRVVRSIVVLWGLGSLPSWPAPDGVMKAFVGAQTIQVEILVKPGEDPTTIEPTREGMVPVVILTSEEFDSGTVDPATVRVGAAGTEAAVFRSAVEDIDGDGDSDLMLLVRVPQMQLTCDDTAVHVKGRTLDGREFEGSKAVTMEGCG